MPRVLFSFWWPVQYLAGRSLNLNQTAGNHIRNAHVSPLMTRAGCYGDFLARIQKTC